MPELTQESTLPAPPDPDDEAIGPPTIDPARFEDFPVFRETFLSFIAKRERTLPSGTSASCCTA